MLSRSPGDDRRFCDSGSQSEKSATGHTIVNDQAWCGKLATGHQKLQMRNTVNIGVAILISARIHKSVIEFRAVNDRIVLLRLDGKPHKFNIIQIYAPTATAEDNEIEEFYNKLELTIRNIPNKELTLICGDFNAKVGNNKMNDDLKNILGKYSLGERNERGDGLIEFAINNSYSIMNTKFKHHIRRVYTWRSPGDRTRNQIDYILTNPLEILHSNSTYTTRGNMWIRPSAPICQNKTQTQNTLQPHNTNKINKKKQRRNSPQNPGFPDYLNRKYNSPRYMGSFQKMHNNCNRIIEDRRLLHRKGIHTEEEKEELKYLNKAIKQGARRDKQQFYSDICKEIEGHSLNNQPRDLFKKIKYITRDFKARNWAIEDQNGTLRTKKEDIIEVWRSYCEDLYKDSEEYNYVDHHENLEKEPDILKSEVELAINKLKYHKAPDSDLMTAEIIKAVKEPGLEMLHLICNKIWHTGEWPDDWTHSTIVTLHKKGSIHKCSIVQFP
ncbi:uncharacterized protein LOC115887568 [Sitophilus oryzae]|uniref:Uncharacterized protein LOC115887568 n=1 Tax=Sitophilus oryzae TaxID=7048 RepID=A0A6J2YFY4_SITOR|nr:uncharacterized protein LOC115887568 [Sitophilus oryzae]